MFGSTETCSECGKTTDNVIYDGTGSLTKGSHGEEAPYCFKCYAKISKKGKK